ncbi:MAG: hypothetical protein H6737_11610 [Alphaproteobacteria bacterium]|nr:hypothetical protein [Alphaproteobacteria bacterium]
MRPLLFLALGACSHDPTDPLAPVEPSESLGGRIDATWEVYDEAGPTDCPSGFLVQVLAPSDTEAVFDCSDFAGTVDPAPTGQYVIDLVLYDAVGEEVDRAQYAVHILPDASDSAYAGFLLF